MLRIKNKAAAQATFDEDYNVPDVKPDIGRLVQSKADVSMEEVRLSEDIKCRFALCGGKRGQDLQPFCEASAG